MRKLMPLLGCALFVLGGCGAAVPQASTLPKDFLPSAISFWTARSGIMTGVNGATNTVYLAATSDGGRTWRVRLRLPERRLYVADPFVDTSSSGRGWFTFETCVRSGGYPFTDCTIHALQTGDGGAHWKQGGPRSTSFSFVGRSGWAIAPYRSNPLNVRLYRLTAASRGPELMQAQVSAPCSGDALGSSPSLGGVASLGGQKALLVCVGQEMTLLSAVTVQAKYFYETSDGGKTWDHILTVPASVSGSVLSSGAFQGMTFLPGSRGWLWSSRGGLYGSDDGGRNWIVTPLVRELEVEEPLSVSFAGARIGYALLQGRPGGPYISLMQTRDGGATWTAVGGWTPPAY